MGAVGAHCGGCSVGDSGESHKGKERCEGHWKSAGLGNEGRRRSSERGRKPERSRRVSSMVWGDETLRLAFILARLLINEEYALTARVMVCIMQTSGCCTLPRPWVGRRGASSGPSMLVCGLHGQQASGLRDPPRMCIRQVASGERDVHPGLPGL